METKTVDAIKEFLLEDTRELQNVVRELNSWDGSFEEFNVMENDEEFFNTYFEGRPMEAVRAAHFGDYNYGDDYVRFNGYGNLETLNEWQIEKEMLDSIDEIVEVLIEKYYNIDIDSELEELIEDYLNDEEEDEEE